MRKHLLLIGHQAGVLRHEKSKHYVFSSSRLLKRDSACLVLWPFGELSLWLFPSVI